MTQKQKGVIIGLAILALVSIGTAIYFIFSSQEKTEKITQLEEDKTELQAEIQELDQKIKELESEISNKDIEIEEKDQRIQDLEKKLHIYKAKINKYIKAGKLSQKQIEEYKFKMEQMQYYLEKYKKEIAELKRENEVLKQQNTELTQEIQKKDSVTFELERKTSELETKVEMAKVLKAVNFKFISVNKRGKEDSDLPIRSRRTATLKVCFTILDNPVAEPGKRDVYMVLKGPNGVYKNITGGSGYFTFNNKELPYTSKVTVSYDRTKKYTCIAYKLPEGEKLQKGYHKAEIYIDGFLVGSETFEVK